MMGLMLPGQATTVYPQHPQYHLQTHLELVSPPRCPTYLAYRGLVFIL